MKSAYKRMLQCRGQVTGFKLILCLLVLLAAPARAELDLAAWNTLLGEAVNDGHVDYGLWVDNPQFDALVDQIANADTAAMTRQEKLVFYINAYNVLAAKGIIDGKSPSSLLGRYGYFKRDKYLVAGQSITLYDLEHDLILPLEEPRIHFAIVCASASCPILQSEAYTLERLDAQLEAAAIGFINDPERNTYDVANKKMAVSSIFKWFKDDFNKAAGSLQAYLAPYVQDPEVAAVLRDGGFKTKYQKYDWSLNGQL